MATVHDGPCVNAGDCCSWMCDACEIRLAAIRLHLRMNVAHCGRCALPVTLVGGTLEASCGCQISADGAAPPSTWRNTQGATLSAETLRQWREQVRDIMREVA